MKTTVFGHFVLDEDVQYVRESGTPGQCLNLEDLIPLEARPGLNQCEGPTGVFVFDVEFIPDRRPR